MRVQLTVDGLAHVLCMTELLDTADTCRHLSSHNQADTLSPTWSPCVDRSRASPRRQHIDNCCTLHCRSSAHLLGLRAGHARLRSVCARRLERDVGDINRYLRLYLDCL